MKHVRTRGRAALVVAAALLVPLLGPASVAQQERSPSGEQLVPGATLRLFELATSVSELPELAPGQTPNVDKVVERLDLDSREDFGGPEDAFYCEVTGWLVVERPGETAFRLESDDGSSLEVDGNLVVDNDGEHAPESVDGSAKLERGLHGFRVRFFEAGGGQVLRLSWKPAGADEFTVLGPRSLRTEKNVVRVTSPGPKVLMGPGGPMRPGAGMPLDRMHPSFRVVDLRPEGFRPQVGGLAVLPDGDLVVASFRPNQEGWADGVDTDPDGVLYRVSNAVAAEGPDDVRVSVMAEGFHEPAGLLLLDGALYVSQREEITRLRDPEGDLSFSDRGKLAGGWTADNYHHFTFGLGYSRGTLGATLYAALSTSIYLDASEGEFPGLNGPNPPNRGTLVEVSLWDGSVRYTAGGFRTPDGVCAADGRVYVTDNQGAWNPSNSLYVVRPGRFYGHYNSTQKSERYPDGGYAGPFDDRPVSPPAVHLPQNECANSPTQPVPIEGGEFAGQLLVGDLKAGGIRRIFLEEVGGEEQGCVFRFAQGLECGVHRLAWGPDGKLFVGGTGASDTWSWNGTRWGLQRLDPTGETAFEMKAVRATPDGFVVEYTRPVPFDQLVDTARWHVSQWRYEPTPEYGGEKVDREDLAVAWAEPSEDERSVRLVIPGLREGRVVHLYGDATDESGESLWSPETWYTLNARPHDRVDEEAKRALVFTRTTGFRHGSIPDGWRCMEELARENGFTVRITEDPAWFTDDVLAGFDAVVFLNTTGDVLDDEQQAATERFVANGGGYLGVHSASDTEYDWPWYGRLVGAYFASHPRIQDAVVRVVDGSHPSTEMLPLEWKRRDEWYNFRAPVGDDVRVLLSLDQSSYEGSAMPPGRHATAWCHEYGGGRAVYTAGGHTEASYTEPCSASTCSARCVGPPDGEPARGSTVRARERCRSRGERSGGRPIAGSHFVRE
ncbi:MAG: ThuA domain-containing protein [Planctomycetota bacterium]